MRRNQTQKIGDLLKEFSQSSKFNKKLNETKIIENWERILGKTISSATRNIYIQNRVLYVYLDSSVIRHELFMMRTQLIDALNESVNQKVIDHIVFK